MKITERLAERLEKADPPHLKRIKARFIVIAVLLVTAVVFTPLLEGQPVILPVLVLCSIAFVSNLLSLIWTLRGRGLRYRIYFATFIDVLLITIAIHYIGGIESTFSWIYVLAMITVAWLHGIRVGIYVATVSSIMYTVLLVAEFSGFIPHVGFNRINPIFLTEDPTYLYTKLLSSYILFFITAGVSGALSQRLIRSKSGLEKAVVERTEELATANEKLRQEISARMRSEQALRLTQFSVDRSADAAYWMGSDARFIYVNEAACRSLGYTREELLSMTVHDIDPGFPPSVWPDHWKEVKERGSFTVESRHRTKDGHVFPVEVTANHVEFEGKEYNCAFVHNITERKRAEEALRESEGRYRLLAENVKDLIWTLDLKTLRFTYFSPSVETMRGYTVEEASDQTLEEVLTPSSLQRAMRSLAGELSPDNVRKEGSRWSRTIELEQTRKDGSTMWVEATVTFVRDANGKPVELLGVSRDITARRQSEEALRESEEKFRSLFEEAKDGVFISTPDGHFLDINPAGIEIYGYSSKEEILAVDIARNLYVNPEDREAIKAELAQHGFVKDYEMIHKRKDGQIVIVLETVTAVHDNAGTIVAYRGLIRDVTEQKQLQRQLYQAQRMESIGTLAGGIAHDFNNILGGILGYASFMKTKMEEDHPFFKYVDTIERSSVRAAELTSQLLAFARGGKYVVTAVDLKKVVVETLKIIESTFDRSIEIETHLHPDLPTVEGDSSQLQQVLMNLCVNARDAMPAGGKLLIEASAEKITEGYIKTHMGATAGSFVKLSVTDTGIGMDKETEERIFEPFFTTKEKGKGTGLGLSMVYGVIKNHKGYVRVYSEPGYGTTFKIYLPISGKPEEEDSAAVETLQGGNELVLVVDDEEPIRSLAKEMLESSGYRVMLAKDGKEAVGVFQKYYSEIYLVILDLIMPRMGGRETFLRLKEVDPNVRTLLSTGYSQNGKAQEILDSGVMGFLQKPYQLNALLSGVRSVLDAKVSV